MLLKYNGNVYAVKCEGDRVVLPGDTRPKWKFRGHTVVKLGFAGAERFVPESEFESKGPPADEFAAAVRFGKFVGHLPAPKAPE